VLLLHDCPDGPFRLAVGPGHIRSRETLFYLRFTTIDNEFVTSGISFVFFPVVAVPDLYRIRDFSDHLVEELARRMRCLARQDRGVEFPAEVIYGDEKILSGICLFLPLEKRKAFRVPVEHLARVALVVPLRRPFEPLFNVFFDLRETAKAPLKRTESGVDARVDRKVPLPPSGEYLIYGWTGDAILVRQLTDLCVVPIVLSKDLLPLKRSQSGALVDFQDTYSSGLPLQGHFKRHSRSTGFGASSPRACWYLTLSFIACIEKRSLDTRAS
jgi:hypothetical protein